MDWKKAGKKLLFPPIAVLFALLPLGIGGMLLGMICLGKDHPLTIVGYVLSFYTLTIWCVRIPEIICFFRTLKKENKYSRAWFGNQRLRMNVTLVGNVLWNGAYGALQLGMGISHRSAWFYSLAGYYVCLAVMRLLLVRHTLRNEPGKEQKRELHYYRTCGWIFLVLNLALFGMMLNMVRENRVTHHHEITTIAVATYTFVTLTMAIVNIIRYRKYNSPVITAARAVSLTAACVSMFSLENTMLVTFDSGKMTSEMRRLFLALSGGVILMGIVVMAIYMIWNASRKLRILENENGKERNF